MKILFTDDNPEIVTCLMEMFEKDDIVTMGATSFEDAIDELDTRSFDLIVTDFDLDSSKSAINLIEAVIKRRDFLGNPPIIIYSGHQAHDLKKSLKKVYYPKISVVSKPNLDLLSYEINKFLELEGN